MASDWRKELLTRPGRNGAPATLRPVIANVVSILSNDDGWRGVIALDAFREATVTCKPPPWDPQDAPQGCTAGEWSDADSARACSWLSRRYGLDVKPTLIDAAVAVIAERRRVHPVRDWLEGLKWDGQPRADLLFVRYFGAEDTEYARGVAARFLIGAVARVYRPGAKVDCTPVLEGTQGIGKSTGVRKLAGEEFFFDTPMTMGEKDSYQGLRGKWIGELGELHALSRSDLNRAKNFLTATVDHYRPSFGRRARDFQRQCVFVGTTNAEEYLRDETGNRRFWPVRCGAVDIKTIAADRAQIWAEAVARYKAGERWHVDTKEFAKLCEAEQEDRFVADAWESPVEEWILNPGHTERRTNGVTTGEVLAGALGIEADKWSKADQDRVAAVLRRLGWARGKQARNADGQRERRWQPRPMPVLVAMSPGAAKPKPVTEPVTPLVTRENKHDPTPVTSAPAHEVRTHARAPAMAYAQPSVTAVTGDRPRTEEELRQDRLNEQWRRSTGQ